MGLGPSKRLYLPHLSNNHDVHDLATQAAAGVLSRDISTNSAGILLLEDDADVWESLTAQVNSLPYEALEAENGVNSLAALADGVRIGLLFKSVMMPSNLIELELALRIALRDPTVKIVFMTSDSDEPLPDTGSLDRDAIVLHKTHTRAILMGAISRALE